MEYYLFKKNNESLTIADIATDMFKQDSIYLKLRTSRGYDTTIQTIKIKIGIINKYIIPKFGKYAPDEIKAVMIDNWLLSLDIANASKNNILTVLREIFSECLRNELIQTVPNLINFKRKTHKKDIFTIEELNKLFPRDYTELEKVWSSANNECYLGIDGQLHSYDFMYAVMFNLIMVTGMRVGEISALSIGQYKKDGIILDRMIDAERQVQFFLKKGSLDNPKTRAVIIPEYMTKLLDYYLSIKPKVDVDFMFTYRGNFVKKENMDARFRACLKKHGLLSKDSTRILTPHSLRFTYNTYMVKGQFPQQVLRQMIGHTSEQMTDYYTRPNLEVELTGLKMYQKQIDLLWS